MPLLHSDSKPPARGADPQMRKLEASLESLRGAAREYAAARGHDVRPRSAVRVLARDRRAASLEPNGTAPIAAPEAARAGLVARVVARLRRLGRKLSFRGED